MKKIYLLTSLLLFLCNCLMAQWDGNISTVNNPVSTAETDVYHHITVTDGADGIIAVWDTYNDLTSAYEIYAQRKTSTGSIAWGDTDNSLQVVSFPGSQNNRFDLWDVKPDGHGGVYVSFGVPSGNSSSAIYLQRIGGDGNLLFGAGAIQVSNPDNLNKGRANLCADSSGVIVAWDNMARETSLSPDSPSRVFAQRYSTTGVRQWAEGGIVVSVADGEKGAPFILPDGNKGAFIVFADTRNTVDFNPIDLNGFDLYAQHISNIGTQLWGPADVPVSTGGHIGNLGLYFSLVSDNAGGLIVLYEDWKNAYNTFHLLTAQRLNGNGAKLWANDGIPIYVKTGGGNENGSGAISDGMNGIICDFIVLDQSAGIYLQHIDGNGNRTLGSEGKIISESGSDVTSSSMFKDSNGNYAVCWTQSDTLGPERVRAQLFNSADTPLWTAGGVNICTNPDAIPENVLLVKSNASSMIAVWDDFRNGDSNATDIYSAKIGSNGTLINTASATYYSAASGNWNNPATWAGNLVPPVGAVVMVTNAVTVNTNITCTTLTVQAPGSLTVLSGFTVTVLQ